MIFYHIYPCLHCSGVQVLLLQGVHLRTPNFLTYSTRNFRMTCTKILCTSFENFAYCTSKNWAYASGHPVVKGLGLLSNASKGIYGRKSCLLVGNDLVSLLATFFHSDTLCVT